MSSVEEHNIKTRTLQRHKRILIPGYRELENTRRRALYFRLKDAIYLKLGNKCSNPACQWLNGDGSRGCTDRRCLQIDHINGDGTKDRKLHKTNLYQYYKTILEDVTGRFQLLCANCNWIKRYTNKEQ
jgi:hypothetical protein